MNTQQSTKTVVT